MERWTDWQLIKAVFLTLIIIWLIAMFANGPLDRLLEFFGMQ